ncbi:electron transport complex subunit RsxC [Methyloversatilis thermotolerans]|uniref:electron transport complex subunit RsxC n=1 Tax=Methyloversatilis thermotolerans TaxID=1346290 RepID=UPI000364E7EB|nr:electron transport complex subunit RsxC [Methyloversatilis thermotolerans]
MAHFVIPPIRHLLTRWGIHPDAHKFPAADLGIVDAGLPPLIVLPLAQQAGAPARPVVKVGEHVLKGQRVADPAGAISAAVHASTSGTVIAIGEAPMPHPSGLPGLAISLRPDGEDRWVELHGDPYPIRLEPAEISRRVAEAGVVGMGGAAFPAAVKLALGQRSAIDTVILNGSECEPYLSCDDRVMRENAADIIEGSRLIMRATGAKRVLVGIEDNKPEAIDAMKVAAHPFPEVSVVKIPSRYPMGAERQLIYTLLGVEPPAGGRAADVGVVVHNVGTAAAVWRALRYGEPLIERVVTVAGGAIASPRNLRARVGTPLQWLIDRAGGLSRQPARMVVGGPMMGVAVGDLDIPIGKGASGVLALTHAEVGEREPSACIRCGSCVSACPVGLLPLEMANRIHAGELGQAEDIGLRDCLTCGACGYVCPSRIPLVQYFMHARGELVALEREGKRLDRVRELTEARSGRLEREAREKAEAQARRKAERAAAAKKETAA